MKFDAVLPVIGLMLTIYVVTKVRESLRTRAMFANSLTRSCIGERIAHGAQLALGTLIAIVAVAAFWNQRPESKPPKVLPTEQQLEASDEQHANTSLRWLSDP